MARLGIRPGQRLILKARPEPVSGPFYPIAIKMLKPVQPNDF